MVESTDAQKPEESSDADSSISETSERNKIPSKNADLKSEMVISTLANDIASSREFESESLASNEQFKNDQFKVPKVPDGKPAVDVVEVDGSEESDDSVICLGDESNKTGRKSRTRRKMVEVSQPVVAKTDDEKVDSGSECSQSSQTRRSLRSRTAKNNGSQDISDSMEDSPSKKERNVSEKNKEQESMHSDDDTPLNQLKLQRGTEVEKSPGGTKSDLEDDTPLSLYLTRSQSTETPKSSQEDANVNKEQSKEEPMVVEDTAPEQSCADLFADSEVAKEDKDNKSNDICSDENNLATNASSEVENNTEDTMKEDQSSRGVKMDNGKGRLVRSNRRRRGRMSLDSRKRKSPKTSPKESSLFKKALQLRRRASSPVVAISPLSKTNQALVEKQLSQMASKENEQDAATEKPNGENETSKVEVIDMKVTESSNENLAKDTIDSSERSAERKQMGTLHSLNKGVSKSPPKKGKPFDTPETPTSASKFSSRSQYILERSRRIALAKASPFPLSGRKLLVPKKSPRGILKHSPRVKSPEKSGANIPLAALHNSPKASEFSSHSESPPSFRPIQIPKIYSPSASPSAGILKRRRLSGDTPAESPSPPNKVCASIESSFRCPWSFLLPLAWLNFTKMCTA